MRTQRIHSFETTGSMDDPPHVFIVRIWQESRNAILEWRGSVEYVPTQERVFFRQMEKQVDFIIQKTGAQMLRGDRPLTSFLKRLTKYRK